MTIHRAKGLEFDTVILPGLGRKPVSPAAPLLRWLEHPEAGLLLAPIAPRDGRTEDPIYNTLGRLEREKEDLETTRLLYVAATRARSRLHLLGHAETGRDGGPRPPSGSLLYKFWDSVSHAFESDQAAEEREAPREKAPSGPLLLRRHFSGWSPPPMPTVKMTTVTPSAAPSRLTEEQMPGRGGDEWESMLARHAGTVIHGLLEEIACRGTDDWQGLRKGDLKVRIERRLGRLGTPSGKIDRGAEKVLRAVEACLLGERGRWILRQRKESACEFELSGIIDGRLLRAVVDRTFIEEDGTRWIIDYKSSEPQGEDTGAFMEGEMERYRAQLSAYASLFRQMEPARPLRAGLYFPLMDGWREVPLDEV